MSPPDTTPLAPNILRFAADEAGERLDLFLARSIPGASRAEAQRLIQDDLSATPAVLVNGVRSRPNYRLRIGDQIEVARPAPLPASAQPEAISLSILYEDSDLLVIDKPRGMVVHPAPGSPSGTLVNAVLAHAEDLSGIGGELRPGIVHRLDKDTGGLLMVAKTDEAHRSLQAQIQAKTAQRRYQAILWGVPGFQTATIDAPIGRHPSDRKKMAVITDPRYTSRDARTELIVLGTAASSFTRVEARLQTGRTHQIRVHAAYIGHPIVGDPVYGGTRQVPGAAFGQVRRRAIEAAIEALGGQALHAWSLSFDHPRTGERMEFTAPFPPVMAQLFDILEL